MKKLRLINIFIFSLFLLIGCKETENETSVTAPPAVDQLEKKKVDPKPFPDEIYDSTYGTITMIDTILIQPMALPCGMDITYGIGIHHFEPVAGKTVGI